MEANLDLIRKEDIFAVEESEFAYYLWPKPVNHRITELYRLDKKTGTLETKVVTLCLDDCPDFLDRKDVTNSHDLW